MSWIQSSKYVGEQVTVTRGLLIYLRTYSRTHALTSTWFAYQESKTLRTRVAALESTGSEGLAQLVRGESTREAQGSKAEKA